MESASLVSMLLVTRTGIGDGGDPKSDPMQLRQEGWASTGWWVKRT